jgi:hypothetical protein
MLMVMSDIDLSHDLWEMVALELVGYLGLVSLVCGMLQVEAYGPWLQWVNLGVVSCLVVV